MLFKTQKSYRFGLAGLFGVLRYLDYVLGVGFWVAELQVVSFGVWVLRTQIPQIVADQKQFKGSVHRKAENAKK